MQDICFLYYSVIMYFAVARALRSAVIIISEGGRLVIIISGVVG